MRAAVMGGAQAGKQAGKCVCVCVAVVVGGWRGGRRGHPGGKPQRGSHKYTERSGIGFSHHGKYQPRKMVDDCAISSYLLFWFVCAERVRLTYQLSL